MQWKARCCRESNSASPTRRRGVVQPRTSAAVRVCPSYPSHTRWRQLALYFRRRPEVPVKRTFSIFAGLAFSVGQTANCDRVVVVFPHPAAGGRGCPQVRGHVPHTPCGPSRTAESNEEVVLWFCLSTPSKPNPSFPLHASDAQKGKAGKRSERFEPKTQTSLIFYLLCPFEHLRYAMES